MRLALALALLIPAVLAVAVPKNSLTVEKNKLPYLFEHYYRAFSLNNPAGKYSGSKSVLGKTIVITTVFEATELSFDVSGPITVSCSGEDYTVQGTDINIVNVGKAGDCVHDALADNSVKLLGITYDPSSDTLLVSLKYSILTISIELSSVVRVPARLPFTPFDASEVTMEKLKALLLTNPAGTYSGSKSILGETIDVTIVIDSDTDFDISITGAFSISCNNEAYTYADGVVTVTNKDKSGDCIHDELTDNAVTLKGVTYNAATDSLAVSVRYTIFSFEFDLSHQAKVFPIESHKTALSFPKLVESYYPVFALNDPSGTYEGVKTVLGQKVDTVLTLSDTGLGFQVSGVISISCSNEVYSYSDGVITLADIGRAGDCVHDALAANGCSLKSITYDTTSDEIHVEIKASFVTISLDLKHQARVARSLPAITAQPETSSLAYLVEHYYPLFALQSPNGTYAGSKSVFGLTVSCKTTTVSDELFNIEISGPVSISCQNQKYTYANGVITVVDIGVTGNCMHDALKDNGVTLNNILYDETADHIQINLKYGFLSLSLELDHVARN